MFKILKNYKLNKRLLNNKLYLKVIKYLLEFIYNFIYILILKNCCFFFFLLDSDKYKR